MRRRLSILATLAAILVGLAVPATSLAADSAPLPASMAAVGDSISQAASTGGSLGADYPQNAWSTGTNSSVNSHYQRLLTAGAPISGRNHNLSVSGAKVADLAGQMAAAVALQPDYLTVLIGGNDLCTDTVTGMTSVPDFRSRFAAAMGTLASGSPDTYVYVVSIPDVYQLWELFRGQWWPRFIWSAGDICQSLLANPTSNQAPDVQRRATVRQRNIDFNAQLAEVCAAHASRCRWDGNAAFDTRFVSSDVSADYFHPSTTGQAKLAAVSWQAGYAWTTTPTTNQPPIASWSVTCTDLTCAFTDTSTDMDGTIDTHSWMFGDGATSTAANPSHTYAQAGTYLVDLTVTDDDGASASNSGSVTVVAPEENEPPSAAFTASCADLVCEFTDASSDPDGTIATHQWAFGDGAASTAVNPSHTYTAANTYTVTLTVTDDDGTTATTTQSVTVTAASSSTMSVASLAGASASTGKNTWAASVTITVFAEGGAPVAGAIVTATWSAGAGDTCTTGATGQCTVQSDNLNKRKVASITLTVTDVSHASYAYIDPVPLPSIAVQRPG